MLHFVGIGAQKSGTSWLFINLNLHPDISFPGGKEICFWTRYYERGLSWWLDHFQPSADPKIRQGEISPDYAILSEERIQEFHAAIPHVTLFYSMRNPLERAWSATLMYMENSGLSPAEMDDAWFIEHFRSNWSRKRGSYRQTLERWYRYFPPEQLAINLFEEITQTPRPFIKRLAQHLQVDPTFYDTVPDEVLGLPWFVGARIDLRPSLIDVLREIYAPEIERLQSWLGRDLSAWLAWDGKKAPHLTPRRALAWDAARAGGQ